MKTLFIDQLTAASGRIVDVFVVSQADTKAKKDGSPYLTLTLKDKTGSISAKLWEIPADCIIRAGDFIKVEGDVSTYKDMLQLTIKRVRVLDRSEVTIDDFLPVSKRDRDELLADVFELIELIERDDLRGAVGVFVNSLKPQLRDAPAAKSLHQPYLGGLMEHVLGIGRAAISVCAVYPALDQDILIAAAVVHDIGKLQELTWDTSIAYGRIGQLVGHVTLGAIMWDKFAQELDPVTKDHVAHIIASHHGQLEYGAAKLPQTREAFVFNLLDQMDARLAGFEIAFAGGVDASGFTPFDHRMGTALWNGQ